LTTVILGESKTHFSEKLYRIVATIWMFKLAELRGLSSAALSLVGGW